MGKNSFCAEEIITKLKCLLRNSDVRLFEAKINKCNGKQIHRNKILNIIFEFKEGWTQMKGLQWEKEWGLQKVHLLIKITAHYLCETWLSPYGIKMVEFSCVISEHIPWEEANCLKSRIFSCNWHEHRDKYCLCHRNISLQLYLFHKHVFLGHLPRNQNRKRALLALRYRRFEEGNCYCFIIPTIHMFCHLCFQHLQLHLLGPVYLQHISGLHQQPLPCLQHQFLLCLSSFSIHHQAVDHFKTYQVLIGKFWWIRSTLVDRGARASVLLVSCPSYFNHTSGLVTCFLSSVSIVYAWPCPVCGQPPCMHIWW